MSRIFSGFAPPRILAFVLSAIVLGVYQGFWRPVLLETRDYGDVVPFLLAAGCSLTLGYALAMLIWLVRQTRGQLFETFRPSRARLIAAVCLAAVTPVLVVNWMPIVAGLALVPSRGFSIDHVFWFSQFVLAAYPVAAMIVRHTFERRLLRFGMFVLCFWSVYACHLLWRGILNFVI